MRVGGGFAPGPGPAPLRDQSVGGFDLSIGNAAPVPHERVCQPAIGTPAAIEPPVRAPGPAFAHARARLRLSSLPMIRHATIAVDTPGRGLVEITPRVSDWVAASGIEAGLLTLF